MGAQNATRAPPPPLTRSGPQLREAAKGKRQVEKLVRRRWGGDHGKQDTRTRDRRLSCLVPKWCFIVWKPPGWNKLR